MQNSTVLSIIKGNKKSWAEFKIWFLELNWSSQKTEVNNEFGKLKWKFHTSMIIIYC